MIKKLYVGNLAFTVTENTVLDLFSQHGGVDSCKLIVDRDTGRSKGFAFVEMSAADADKAVEDLNGQDLEGRSLKVNEARPQEPRSSGYSGGRRGY